MDESADTAKSANLDRRDLLRYTAMTGAAVAIPSWLLAACGGSSSTSSGGGSAANVVNIKATHGTGLCNLGIFLAKERQLGKSDGINLNFVVTPSNADIATLFGAGQVDASLIPYTNFMTLYDAGAPVKIVAGGGVQAASLSASPGSTRQPT